MRKKFFVVLLLTLLSLFLPTISSMDVNTNSSIITEDYFGNEFYVDLGGDDSNSG